MPTSAASVQSPTKSGSRYKLKLCKLWSGVNLGALNFIWSWFNPVWVDPVCVPTELLSTLSTSQCDIDSLNVLVQPDTCTHTSSTCEPYEHAC